MTFVADFTPEQLQNASAGRRYGQRKREAQEAALRALVEQMNATMHPNRCCRIYTRQWADRLANLLTRRK